MPEKIRLTEKPEQFPICPHCEKRLTEICWHKVQGAGHIGYIAVYSCPHCKKLLSTSASRG